MTDFCHIVSISFNSTLRCTSLSKSHWLFCLFSTPLYFVIEEPLALLHLRDARREYILSPHLGSSRKSTGFSLSGVEIQPLRGCKKWSFRQMDK